MIILCSKNPVGVDICKLEWRLWDRSVCFPEEEGGSMVILATRNKEIGTNPLLDANCTFDANSDREFSVKIARCNWTKDMTFGNLVYVPDTEYGGIIEDVLTDTSLDYVELKGYTWRGRMEMKVIEPPSGSDYRVVSGS